MGGKRKTTSIRVDPEFWREWQLWVFIKYGSTHKISQALEDAMRAFMKEGKEKEA